jgi:hypothetical protein
LQIAAQEAVCRPRIDIRIPTSDPAPGEGLVQGRSLEDGPNSASDFHRSTS